MKNRKGQLTFGSAIGITVSFIFLLLVIIMATVLFSALKDSDDFLETNAVTNDSVTGTGVAEANVSLANDKISVFPTNIVIIDGGGDRKEQVQEDQCTKTDSTIRCGNFTLFGTEGLFAMNGTDGSNESAVWLLNYTHTDFELGRNASLNAAQGLNQITGQASNIGLILAISMVLSIVFGIFVFMQRRQ